MYVKKRKKREELSNSTKKKDEEEGFRIGSMGRPFSFLSRRNNRQKKRSFHGTKARKRRQERSLNNKSITEETHQGQGATSLFDSETISNYVIKDTPETGKGDKFNVATDKEVWNEKFPSYEVPPKSKNYKSTKEEIGKENTDYIQENQQLNDDDIDSAQEDSDTLGKVVSGTLTVVTFIAAFIGILLLVKYIQKRMKKKVNSKGKEIQLSKRNGIVHAIKIGSPSAPPLPSSVASTKNQVQSQTIIPKAFVIESTNIGSPFESHYYNNNNNNILNQKGSLSPTYPTEILPEVQILSPTPGLCPGCETNSATLAVMPCGHLVCDQCEINPCPTCGKKTVDAMTVL